MSLEEKIYQMFIVSPEQLTGASVVTDAGNDVKKALSKMPVGGIICFAQNIKTPKQTTSLISKLQDYSKYGLFIAVDEEGGKVARIAKNESMGTTVFPNMKKIGDTGNTDKAYNVGWTIGNEIQRFGFNIDFAPVADVNSNPDNPVIGERSFGSTPEVVSKMVAAAVKGFNDSGVGCAIKHFPGHGDTATDSHKGYTETVKTLEELQKIEFEPLAAGIYAGVDFVMIGHISVPNVTGNDIPATLSKPIIDILKNDLRFKGLVITDAMRMEAITQRYSSAEAAIMAVNAGVDIILLPDDLQAAAKGIYNAVKSGKISEERIDESVLKILETKMRLGIIVQ